MLNSISKDLTNCRIYVGLFPCNECTKVILQSGISEIIYLSDKYRDTASVIASKKMLDLAAPRISYRQLITERRELLLSFMLPEQG
ncbi:MAG: hypothetical protein CSA20_10140 [Deltaproteobacteria bacterium]|nr:MAG: hypothetical protein CSA20_10140 [Deltaproteobacteria bacterium]